MTYTFDELREMGCPESLLMQYAVGWTKEEVDQMLATPEMIKHLRDELALARTNFAAADALNHKMWGDLMDRDWPLVQENLRLREALKSIKWITRYSQIEGEDVVRDHATGDRSLVELALGVKR